MRGGLRRVAEAAAVPYGFTILIAASGGMLIRSHGPPDLGEGLMLVCGAALAFATVALAARGAEPSPLPGAVLLGLSSGLAAAAGTIVAHVIAREVHGDLAFGLVAYAVTSTYFAIDAIGVGLVTSRRRPGPPARPPWLGALPDRTDHRAPATGRSHQGQGPRAGG